MTLSPITPLIGVLGGMGPLATVDFLQKIVASTPASRDQDHVPLLIWNVPQIPDRQKALAGTGESPLPTMLQGIRRLNEGGATRIAIPCNTAHLWSGELAAASLAPLIHIVDAALAAVERHDTQGAPVGIVATRGTLAGKLYQDRLSARNIPYLINTDDEIDSLFTPGCYAIKQNRLDQGGALLESAARQLIRRGAQTLILACSEVPVGLVHLRSDLLPICVDPTQALADACIDYWRQTPHCPTGYESEQAAGSDHDVRHGDRNE
ncbi:glutamate racemase [Betaproteobacteria bacterium]|nr:glutamate racemase [Betaproteobacteria bacterium]GHU00650.1 glutamate racemase [Betaproteobacteria bacterium]GHU31598.1 glutamate racemase [Betaproteobacteria bacterium]